jgi:Zn-dependent peptidase ImmA (M78 family)
LNDPTPGEQLVASFGIKSPDDLDVTAIARVLGAEVRYEPLTGCEARIVGTATRAIIRINSRSQPTRQRFSIAHEIAHWRFDRKLGLLVCNSSDMETGDHPGRDISEKLADRVASHILMPRYLVEPLLGRLSTITFDSVKALAGAFSTSITASAIRLIDLNLVPSVLVCHRGPARGWFSRAKDVPDHWFPRARCIPGSDNRRRVPASNWFDCDEADDAEVTQESLSVGAPGETLSLLTGFTSAMLKDREAQRRDDW